MRNMEDDIVKYLHFEDPFVLNGEAKKLKLRPETVQTYQEVLENMIDVMQVASGQAVLNQNLEQEYQATQQMEQLSQQEKDHFKARYEILSDVVEIVDTLSDDVRQRLTRAVVVGNRLQRALLANADNIEQWDNYYHEGILIRRSENKIKSLEGQLEKKPTLAKESADSPIKMQAAINVVQSAFDDVLERARQNQSIQPNDVTSMFSSPPRKTEASPSQRNAEAPSQRIKPPRPRKKAVEENYGLTTPVSEQVETPSKEDESDYTIFLEDAEPIDTLPASYAEYPDSEDVIVEEKDSLLSADSVSSDFDFSSDPEAQELLRSIASQKERMQKLSQEKEALSKQQKEALSERTEQEKQVVKSREELEKAKKEREEEIKKAKRSYLESLKRKVEQQAQQIRAFETGNQTMTQQIQEIQQATDKYRKEVKANTDEANQVRVNTQNIVNQLANFTATESKSGLMSSYVEDRPVRRK